MATASDRLRRTARGSRRPRTLAVALLAILLLALPAGAYETDQYTDRLQPIADSTEILDALINREIDDLAAHWDHGRNPKRFARELFWRIGGLHWVDKVERWAMNSPAIERIHVAHGESIYSGMPLWVTRVVFVFGVGDSLKVNGSLIGTDKFGHFLSQGRKYYRHYLRGGSPETITRQGLRNETGIFGRLTTGVFSNADLVANYEGYLFFRSLFEDGIVPGKPAIVRWEGDRPVVQRPFTWADHVNDFWDEALNPSNFVAPLEKRLQAKLRGRCDQYLASPSSWVPRREAELEARYAPLKLRYAPQNRMDHLCAGVTPPASSSTVSEQPRSSAPPARPVSLSPPPPATPRS